MSQLFIDGQDPDRLNVEIKNLIKQLDPRSDRTVDTQYAFIHLIRLQYNKVFIRIAENVYRDYWNENGYLEIIGGYRKTEHVAYFSRASGSETVYIKYS